MYLNKKLAAMGTYAHRADNAAHVVIPLFTTHGGHPQHIMLVPKARKPPQLLEGRQRRRRNSSAKQHHTFVQPSSTITKLTPAQSLQLLFHTQMSWRAMRHMRSFLISTGHNVLAAEQTMRQLYRTLLPSVSLAPTSCILDNLSSRLLDFLNKLHSFNHLTTFGRPSCPLFLQVTVDKGGGQVKALLKIINCVRTVGRRNLLPLFSYDGDEATGSRTTVAPSVATRCTIFSIASVVCGPACLLLYVDAVSVSTNLPTSTPTPNATAW